MKGAFSLLKETFVEWRNDDAMQWGAALSYYVALAMAPLLVIILFITGFAFGKEAVRGQLVGQIRDAVGQEGAEVIQNILQETHRDGSGLFALLASIGMLIIGATGVFGQLQKALNRIWDVKARPKSGLLRLLKVRLLGLGMVLVIGFLLLVSLLLSTAVSAAAEFARGAIPLGEDLARVLEMGVSAIVITLLFALIYKVLPDVEIGWREVWVGAIATAALFIVGKFLLGLYLGHSSVGSSYGAAGSLVAILVWLYYSSQIVLFGAEFTQVWARRHGERIVPAPHAAWIREPT